MEKLARPGQRLEDHLRRTAKTAGKFCSAWGGYDHAFLTGLWHDLGKYSAAFQSYMTKVIQKQTANRGEVNHSSAGAIHAMRRFIAAGLGDEEDWKAISVAILAHHGALPDYGRFEERLGALDDAGRPVRRTSLRYAEELYQAALAGEPAAWVLDAAVAKPVSRWPPFFARMLYSALVDADRLDAGNVDSRVMPDMPELKRRFDNFLQNWKVEETPINHLRRRLVVEAVKAADSPQGCFALDAPTGFGKTLSSLGFALHHAERHGCERVIYVAPFLTAIEQTATIFRKVLLDRKRRIVLEHHSLADRDLEEQEDGDNEDYGERLAERFEQRENWDARIIVTSNVQFFESLHAHDSKRCRKVHRIANAVVLLDEPQSIPLMFMSPITKALEILSSEYHTSIVFVTATQPSFKKEPRFPHGISRTTSLVSPTLLTEMRTVAASRINVTLPKWGCSETWQQIARRFATDPNASLCIVNTRKQARDLFNLLRSEKVPLLHHLSAAMCSSHRLAKLAEINDDLNHERPAKVVSTQVVEAGIDIDFPHVMRAHAGLDSLIQSAGRCNRHGKHASRGSFEVFLPDEAVPYAFRVAADQTRILLSHGRELFDPLTSALFYKAVRDGHATDSKGILKSLEHREFTTVGRAFRLIEDSASVVIPYGDGGRNLVSILLSGARDQSERGIFDRIQGLTVSISKKAVEGLREAGVIAQTPVVGLWAGRESAYSLDVGLVTKDVANPDENWMI